MTEAAKETRATAGTAGDGYMVDPRLHPFAPEPLEPGRRPLCLVCGGEKDGHLPTPRHPAPRKTA